MRTNKELIREVKLLNLTEKYDFELRLNNLVEYNQQNIIKRKKILGLSIGSKYKVTHGASDIKNYECVKFLSDNFDVIVTGSCALKIFGLLDRRIEGDIDIITNQKTIDKLAVNFNEYTYNRRYGDKPDLNYIKSFVINGMKVDTFLNTGQKYRIVDGVKVNEPFEIIYKKLNLSRFKDLEDTERFIKLIE